MAYARALRFQITQVTNRGKVCAFVVSVAVGPLKKSIATISVPQARMFGHALQDGELLTEYEVLRREPCLYTTDFIGVRQQVEKWSLSKA